MALLNIGDDSWLLEYESCEKLYRDIMEQLTTRQQLPRESNQFSQISATIRMRLKQFNNEVDQLHDKVENSAYSNITSGESERRARQVEMLKSKRAQMLKTFSDQVVEKAANERVSLMGPSSSNDFRPEDRVVSMTEIQLEKERMLRDQETGLNNLSQIISRQKNIAQTISSEVDYHNDILDDLGDHMDRTDTRVRNETNHIAIVDAKDKTCIYWVIIILLFISIVIVACV